MAICPKCFGRGIGLSEVGMADGHEIFRAYVACDYEGCVDGIVACCDPPNDGLPKGDPHDVPRPS